MGPAATEQRKIDIALSLSFVVEWQTGSSNSHASFNVFRCDATGVRTIDLPNHIGIHTSSLIALLGSSLTNTQGLMLEQYSDVWTDTETLQNIRNIDKIENNNLWVNIRPDSFSN